MAKKDQMTKFLRRSLQFKLRSFLLILAIVCIWLGWYSVRVQQQREAVDWVLKNGGAVRYDYEYQGQKFIPDSQPSVPKWLLDTLGVDYFSAVTWVELSNMSKQVSDVTPLASLAKLKKLRLFKKDLRLQEPFLIPQEPFLIPVVYVGGAKRDYTAPIVLQMTVQVLPPLRQL